jgi:hypothetical protein
MTDSTMTTCQADRTATGCDCRRRQAVGAARIEGPCVETVGGYARRSEQWDRDTGEGGQLMTEPFEAGDRWFGVFVGPGDQTCLAVGLAADG